MVLNQIASIENFGLLAEFSLPLLFMEVLLFCTSLFLMLLILVQRGKGGGLTGALGGQGGQSAFGSKAGDAFTKITVVTAVFWIMLCMVTIAAFNPPPQASLKANNDAEMSADEDGEATDGDAATTGMGAKTSGETSETDSNEGQSTDAETSAPVTESTGDPAPGGEETTESSSSSNENSGDGN